ncbi:MAG: RNA-binding transcriptional accessory protein [Bacteroidales bacterium]|nr:RNA-binding transcriptional accessory protein [Bacteroidales bacterium]
MKGIYIDCIAEKLGLKTWQVENCVELFAQGGTIPFISRYRKEKTGGMDDASVAEVKHWAGVFEEMEKRKQTVLANIEAAGALTEDLRAAVENCVSATLLEDLYLPYRPKRRTRATVAKELGLEPLADLMWNVRTKNPRADALRFVREGVPDAEAALSGARDIIAERLNENAPVRESLRAVLRQRRITAKVTKAGETAPEADKYRSYFNYSFPLSRIPAHQLLALLRAEREGWLKLGIDADPSKSAAGIRYAFCKEHGYPAPELDAQISLACEDAWKRLLEPSLTGEVLREAKEKADRESIEIFGGNLRQLLLEAPLGQKRVLAVDPGFRNGCKLAALDEHGALCWHGIIYPHPPLNEKIRALTTVSRILAEYRIEAVALGNGTASRETADFLAKVDMPEGCRVWTVSEDGASIYSASDIAREEFPDEDVTVRGAVSIGRRLMDPLSELVKIDPKNLGVGQYQHDVDQNLLREKLDETVEFCVNSVGVNLNTASPYLLSYVAGIGPALAASICARRAEQGAFPSREALRDVPRLGAKTFEQCAGFLRIKGGDNPLDDSAVHPESYSVVGRMAADAGVSVRELVGNAALCAGIRAEDYVTDTTGLPTVRDILKELAKPGLDPREQASSFAFDECIRDIADLRPGMELPGIVTNLTAFGAFVDIGLHDNGLIHVSQMGVKGLRDPSRVLKLHQKIRVEVLGADVQRNRISLRLISDGQHKGE